MNLLTRSGMCALSLAIAMPLTMLPAVTFAQETLDGIVEEIVVTGTRREGVSPTETLSPVEIIGGTSLVN